MPRNIYISHGTESEKSLYEDLIIEAISVYGVDMYYLPREVVQLDKILNEDVISKFGNSHVVEMYIESIDGFEGDGKLITKFGLEIRDQITLVVAKRRWNQLVGRWGQPEPYARPIEGDLIFIPMTKGLYEITYVDDKKPFFQLGNLPTYKLICQLFEYANQEFDTGVDSIDNLQGYHTAGFSVISRFIDSNVFTKNETLSIRLPSGQLGRAKFLNYNNTTTLLDKEVILGPLAWDDGKFNVLRNGTVLTSDTTGLSATIIDVNTVYDSPNEVVVNDDFARNITLENEASNIIDWDENNPFSEGPIS